MATTPLTIDVDAEAARAYLEAAPQERKKLQLLLDLRLQEIVKPSAASLHEIMDRIGYQAEVRGLTPESLGSILAEEEGDVPKPTKVIDPVRGVGTSGWDQEAWREAIDKAAGIWKDRDDLPPLAELRAEWDRF